MPTFEYNDPKNPKIPTHKHTEPEKPVDPASPKAHKAHKDHKHDKPEPLPEDASEVAKVQAEGNAAIADLRESMHPDDGDLNEDEKKAAELDAGYKQRLAEMQGKKDALEEGHNPKYMTNPTNITSPASHLTGGEPQPVDEGEP